MEEESTDARGEASDAGPAPPAAQEKAPSEATKLLDDLFRKTQATPSLYWLPLSEAEVMFLVLLATCHHFCLVFSYRPPFNLATHTRTQVQVKQQEREAREAEREKRRQERQKAYEEERKKEREREREREEMAKKERERRIQEERERRARERVRRR